MRIVFMGTPGFSLPALEKLIENGYEISAVVTQPDKPVGRGRALAPTPVKKLAESHGIPVLQPPSLKATDIVLKLKSLRPDAMVVAAFGQLLPKSVLEIPPLGCINIHPSLLPKYRGSSPVAGAILAGETVTGVSIMLMDEGWDTGPVLAQQSAAILPDDTTDSLENKLAEAGAELLVQTLPRWAAGEIKPQPQDHSQATYTKPIKKEDGRMDWGLPAVELWRRCRAFYPWPSCYTFLNSKQLKILKSRPLEDWRGKGQPGEVVEVDVVEQDQSKKRVGVVAGVGVLLLDEVQLQGSKAMPVDQFARGQRGFVGARLGDGD